MKSLAIRCSAAALAILSSVGIAGCSSNSTESSSSAVSQVSADPSAYAAVIDVRTPEEFAAGHVAEAVNLNAEAADFTAQISALDPAAGTYLIYCRSGNRSAVAAEKMRAAGLTVVDGGGLQDMADAGWNFS